MIKKEDHIQLLEELHQLHTRINSILSPIIDKELMLIKGHLLIEESLYSLLKNRMKKSNRLGDARLTFAQLIVLVEGLYFEEELNISWIYRALEKLNKIRNRLAHTVEPDNITNDIKEFSAYVIHNNAHDNNPKDELLYALSSIHTNLSSILIIDKKQSLLPNIVRSMSFSTQVAISKFTFTDSDKQNK